MNLIVTQWPSLLIGICLAGLAVGFYVWVLTSGRLRSDAIPTGTDDTARAASDEQDRPNPQAPTVGTLDG